MGTIIISTNATLDGVVQDPDGAEDFALGGWFAPAGSPDRVAWAEVETAEAMRADALLLGRHSYEWFASRWNSREGEWADRLRILQKYVVSSTMSESDATWGVTTLLRDDVIEEVAKLKRERDGEIIVYASYQLGQALLANDLVDELWVFVYPVVLGAGRRLFGETGGRKPMHLVDAATVGEGLVLLTYEVTASAGARP